MSTTHTGKQGAKRQSYHRDSPRGILLKLIEHNPSMSEGDLEETMWHEVREKPTVMRAIFEYWFANNLRSIQPEVPLDIDLSSTEERKETKPLPSEEEIKKQEEITQELNIRTEEMLKKAIHKKAQILLLEMVLPNGKTVGDTTGQELREIASTMSNWLITIIPMVPADKKVREVLSEDQLKAAYGGE
jgi:hypothetical protein